MPVEFEITIKDWQAFGEIIKGRSRNPATKPATIKKLKEDLDPAILKIGAGYKDDDAVEYLMAPAMKDKLSFVIPHIDDISEPIPPGTYPLPDFYRDKAFGGKEPNIAFGNTPDEAKARAEVFRSCRIADYAGNKCM